MGICIITLHEQSRHRVFRPLFLRFSRVDGFWQFIIHYESLLGARIRQHLALTGSATCEPAPSMHRILNSAQDFGPVYYLPILAKPRAEI